MPLAPDAKKEFRLQLARYLFVAEKYNYRWDYSQIRPFRGYHLAPSAHHDADCSAYSSLSFYAAGVWSHHGVMDPLGQHYSGIGNTDSAYQTLKAHPAPVDKYRVGDIALYLEGAYWHHHMIICKQEGTGTTSLWSSNGSQSAPNETRLHYRSDLTGVYRHPALL